MRRSLRPSVFLVLYDRSGTVGSGPALPTCVSRRLLGTMRFGRLRRASYTASEQRACVRVFAAELGYRPCFIVSVWHSLSTNRRLTPGMSARNSLQSHEFAYLVAGDTRTAIIGTISGS